MARWLLFPLLGPFIAARPPRTGHQRIGEWAPTTRFAAGIRCPCRGRDDCRRSASERLQKRLPVTTVERRELWSTRHGLAGLLLDPVPSRRHRDLELLAGLP